MMKASIAMVAIAFAGGAAAAQSSHMVQGYVRSDGTYVQPHYQSNPDSSRFNNYSTQGNVNPYTGQAGTVDPYATPQNSFGSTYGSTPRRRGW